VTVVLLTPADAADALPGDLRQIAATGSIAGESHQLTVASANGLKVGDWVIVEIGKEAGKGVTRPAAAAKTAKCAARTSFRDSRRSNPLTYSSSAREV
jgi:hypothetical protein